jgi:arylformamidase
MKIIDLSHTLNNEMPVYPGTEKPSITKIFNADRDGFTEHRMTLTTHTGTHLDAPAHLFTHARCIDDYDISDFMGPAIMIECEKKLPITYDLIKSSLNNSAPPEFILFNTGWESLWGHKNYFHSFPVMDKEAAGFAAGFPLKGIGIDAVSFDAIEDTELKNHKLFLSKNFLLIENLCNLSKLPAQGFHFSCLPLKIAGADGSPVRAIAIIDL